MSLAVTIQHLRDNAALLCRDTAPSLQARIIEALQIRGEFPTSLNVLQRLQHMTSGGGSDTGELARLLQVDHALVLRLLSIANYEHYRTSRPAVTITDAIAHLGAEKLPDVIANLAAAKNFNAIYLARAASLTMMQQSLIAALIARQAAHLLHAEADSAEEAFVLSALINAGPLMLAFLRPDAYSGICLDCLEDRILFDVTFRRLIGRTVGECAAAIADALGLPGSYRALALKYDRASWETKERPAGGKQREQALTTAAYAGNLIAHEICYFTGVQGVQSVVRRLDAETPLSQPILEDILGTVAESYLEQSVTLGLKPLRLPEYLLWFAPVEIQNEPSSWPARLPGINERINPFLYELRQTLHGAEFAGVSARFAHAVHTTLNALVKGLNFDRAVFFKMDEDRKFLQLAVPFGMKLFEPHKVRRFLYDPRKETMPDVLAFERRCPVFTGQPIFSDGWPFAAFPVIWRDQVIGVFYADKVRRLDGDALEKQEETACTALAAEWHDIPGDIE